MSSLTGWKIFGLVFLFGVLFAPKLSYAQSYYFSDEFNESRPINILNSDKWIFYPNQKCGTWPNIKEQDGFVALSQCLDAPQFPLVISKNNPFPVGNWIAEISFQYSKVTPWGDGIVLAESAPSNGGGIPAVLAISVWQDQSLANLRVSFDGRDVYTTVINTNSHQLKVERAGKKYLLYLDNTLIFTSPETDHQVKTVWFGNPTLQNPKIPRWTEFKIDYIRVSQSSPLPVIFIPGIGGSEFKAASDIIWSADNGHGETYSHRYAPEEKVWVNQDEAAALGNDDYFDVLRLKEDGQTPEAPGLELTGHLTPFGYPDIDSFFQEMGYQKGVNFFIYLYDWRKDIAQTKDGLNSLIEEAKQKSGMSKVNLVAHSMGGLAARNYIADSIKASNVHKLISLGVPHLGSVDSLKSLMYGSPFTKKLYGLLSLGIPASEVKDVSQNLPSVFELNPSSMYFNFYNNQDLNRPSPFRDDRDIDNNTEKGILNFIQYQTMLKSLAYNMHVFDLASQFHNMIDNILDKNNSVKLYHIVGSNQPTLGQIKEGWLINWPVNLIPRYEEIYINGDGTVPLYSAALRSDSLDFSGGAKIYYVEQKHSDLPSKSGAAMAVVKAILSEIDQIPVEVKDEKISLEGKQLSLDGDGEIDLYDDAGNHTGLKDSGEVETNIPGTFYSTLGTSRHVFVKKSSPKVKAKVRPTKTTKINLKARSYKEDKISKISTYQNIPVDKTSNVELSFDPNPSLLVDDQSFPPTSEVEGESAADQTPPVTTTQLNYAPGGVTINLTGSDSESGLLKTEYSLDGGETVQTYSEPVTVTTPGTYTLTVGATDKAGNQETPQTTTFTIASTPTPTSTPSPTAASSPTVTPTSAPADSSTSQTSSGSSSGNAAPPLPTPTTQPLIQNIVRIINKSLPRRAEAKEKNVLGTAVEVSPTSPQTTQNPWPNILKLSAILVVGLTGVLILTFLRSLRSTKKTPE